MKHFSYTCKCDGNLFVYSSLYAICVLLQEIRCCGVSSFFKKRKNNLLNKI